jgi:hypothetical protein
MLQLYKSSCIISVLKQIHKRTCMKPSGNYLHIRNDTGEVFYVGLGAESRAKALINRNIHWKRIVEKHGYSIKYLGDRSVEEAKALEKSLIKIFGRRDLKTGLLVNMTDGGDGVFNLADESKEKISASSRNHMTGRKLPDEWRANMTQGVREYYKNNPGARAGQKMSEEENKKRSESLKRFHVENPTACDDKAVKAKKTWANPEVKEKRLCGMKIVMQTTAYKDKISAATKKRYESEDERKKTGLLSQSIWDNYTEQEKIDRVNKLKKVFAQRRAIAELLKIKTNQVTKKVRLANLHLIEN